MSDKTEKLLLLAALGVGAFLFIRSRASAASNIQTRVPAGYSNGTNGNTAPNLVAQDPRNAAWYTVGSLISNLFKGGSASTAAPGASTAPDPNANPAWNQLMTQTQPTYDPNAAPLPLPDDSIAANPPSNVDPYVYEQTLWTGP